MANSVDHKTFRRIIFRNVLLPLAVGLVSCIIFVAMINRLINQSHQVEHSDRIISATNEAFKFFVDAETGLRGFVITDKESFLEPYIRSTPEIPNQLQKLIEMSAGEATQIARIELLKNQFKLWYDYSQEVIKIQQTRAKADRVIIAGRGKNAMDRVREIFNEIVRFEETKREEQSAYLNRVTQIMLVIVSLFTVFSAIMIALAGRRQLLDLSQTYEGVLEESNQRNKLLQRQQLIKDGQNELNDKMAAQYSLFELSQAVLNYFSVYLKAQAGALYLQVEGQKLERTATFAFTEDFSHKRRLSFGEGLIGQAAEQRNHLHLSNLPHDYLRVSSGLGHSTPSQVLIFPFTDENNVLAVLELGFVGDMPEYALDFFNQVADSVAVSIKSAFFREQREALLKEIQNQAEELQTQQEELRVSNEELEEQSRMLKETHVRLEAQQAEMEQTNAQLEEQTQTLESQKDLLDKRNEILSETKVALETKAAELQRASQYKSEFLANMSHELRTPLNSSLILAKLLADNKDGNLNSQQIDFAKQIQSSGNDLLTLINDILDLSKVESGKLDIIAEDINVNDLAKGIERSFKISAQEKGLQLKLDVSSPTSAVLRSDRQRVEQVLKNLVSNALKFTSEGEVKIKISQDADKHFHFEVQDSGIGIRKEQQEIIFEAFRQADGTTNRKFGGTGLGLSISRNLAHLLGGSIEVESEFGKGSCFTLILPPVYVPQMQEDRIVSAPVIISKPKVEFKHSRASDIKSEELYDGSVQSSFFTDDRQNWVSGDRVILVVEDDKKFAGILFDLAHEQNYKCIVTDSAEEALALTRKFSPLAILLDITLSDRSGLFVLDQLKQHSLTRHIPVHIISATDFSRQALHMGAIGYILKPVKRDEIVSAFVKIEEKIKQDIRRVLIVEDNDTQRSAIQKLISDKHLETVAVDTGAKALKALRDSAFDCMIIDLNLPDMSGFEVLEKMNSDKDHEYPPTIVYTGRSLSREEEAELNRYSKSVIIKGAKSPERLLDEVTLFLHRVESDLDPKSQDMLKDLRNRDKVFENKTIMVVDDDMRNTFALTAALEQKGAKVIIAQNGEESLRKLSAEPAIDIVLMDIMMPVMDGYQAIREIRKNQQFKKLPIIALTAKAMKDDHQLCLQAGANDYLPKPVDLDKLLSLARIWLIAGWR